MKNLALVLLAVLATACAKPSGPVTCTGNEQMAAPTGQPSILVIGDSISIGYTPVVRASLTSYDVVHNPCNAMYSGWTLSQVDKWLAARPSYDAITWNNGLWDIADWIGTSDSEYVANLHAIAHKLKAKSPNVMFILSTQVLPGTANRVDANVVHKNALAVTVMGQEGIPVLDLYSVSTTIQADHVSPTDVHYTSAGYQVLGDAVLGGIDSNFGIH